MAWADRSNLDSIALLSLPTEARVLNRNGQQAPRPLIFNPCKLTIMVTLRPGSLAAAIGSLPVPRPQPLSGDGERAARRALPKGDPASCNLQPCQMVGSGKLTPAALFHELRPTPTPGLLRPRSALPKRHSFGSGVRCCSFHMFTKPRTAGEGQKMGHEPGLT